MLLLTTAFVLCAITIVLMVVFHRVFFSANLISAYFYCTITFSVVGVYLYTFTDIFSYQNQFLKLHLLTEKDFFHALLISHGGVILVFLGYIVPVSSSKAFSVAPGLFLSLGETKVRSRRLGVYLVVALVIGFIFFYILKHEDIFISGLQYAIIGSLSDHLLQIELRQKIASDFFFIVFTMSILTYTTIHLLVIRNYTSGLLKYAWIFFFFATIYFHLGIFQKRSLILFIFTVLCAYFSTRKGIVMSGGKLIKITIFSSLIGFSVLVLLYFIIFSGMGNEFSLFKVTSISLMQVLVRLANSVLMTAHIYPDYEYYFDISNVRALTFLLNLDYYPKDEFMFDFFKTSNLSGSTASSALTDFYGGFGWAGLLVFAPTLGFFLFLVEAYIRKQPNTVDRFVFSIFTIWFVYYLTQANFFRAFHGYGFLYFLLLRYLMLLVLKEKRNESNGEFSCENTDWQPTK
jgi:hypothetical protein